MVKSKDNKDKMTAGKWMIPVSSMAPAVPTPAPAAAGPFPSPPPMPNLMPQSGASLDPVSSLIMSANANPYIIGMFMLLLNLGGRFLALELTKKQEAFLSAPWIRPLIFFTVVFIATRNLVAAFWITMLFFFVIWVVANENSPYCMIPSWCDGEKAESATNIYERNVQKLNA